MTTDKPFLTAQWRHLAMINWEVSPDILKHRVPKGTELDSFGGRTFVSVVGFMFLQTKVRGWTVPGHRDFEEVNLRFYVRRNEGGELRRGVTFIKELVPRHAIAWLARKLYNEPYQAMPMRHAVAENDVRYDWRLNHKWNGLSVKPQGEPKLAAPGSLEEFIAEHYWGYTAQRDGGTIEYRVEHPPWRIWQTGESSLDCDVAKLYGEEFVSVLAAKRACAFLAEGSAIKVFPGRRIA